jgi:DNA recombination protein RmuC
MIVSALFSSVMLTSGILLAGLAGIGTVAFVVYLVRQANLSGRREGSRDSQVELARLSERVNALNGDLTAARTEIVAKNSRFEALQLELDAARHDRVKFEERATRTLSLEKELASCQSVISTLREDQAKLNATLAEQKGSYEYVTRQLNEVGTQRTADQERTRTLYTQLQEQAGQVSSLKVQVERTAELEAQLKESEDRWERLGEELTRIKSELAQTSTTLNLERSQSEEKLTLLTNARETLSAQFRSLASDILEEKSKRFTELNKVNLDQVLTPLEKQLQEFQARIEHFHTHDNTDRAKLTAQIENLHKLNRQLSDDAQNLASALKGSTKTQGNWGELILERVLELSGLRKGIEYELRGNRNREDGTQGQPDVVVHMPDQKQLVIDAKVSLNAYTEYTLADTDETRQAALARHIHSVRTHIKGLSAKNYHALDGLESLDFVIMFVPIEPAFALAVGQDNKLWEEAWNKNVLLVSPTMLFFVVRTINYLWNQEKQNRSVQEIAKRGAELYDKLVGFVDEFKEIGKKLDQAKAAHSEAFGRFSTGRGNAIWQANQLRELGVKPSKLFPADLTADAIDSIPVSST